MKREKLVFQIINLLIFIAGFTLLIFTLIPAMNMSLEATKQYETREIILYVVALLILGLSYAYRISLKGKSNYVVAIFNYIAYGVGLACLVLEEYYFCTTDLVEYLIPITMAVILCMMFFQIFYIKKAKKSADPE